MNSIERVRRAVKFNCPDRVPVWSSGLDDVFHMFMLPPKTWQPGHADHERGLFPYMPDEKILKLRLWKWNSPEWAKAPEYRNWTDLDREEIDEWGCIWKQSGKGKSIGHPVRSTLTDWGHYDKYLADYNPDPLVKSRYSFFILLSRLLGRSRYRMCTLGDMGPLSIASAIRGFVPFLTDHRRNPSELKKLLGHITSFFVDSARMWARFGAKPHGFMMYDDLGDQMRPFLSPKMFAEFYEPVYRAIFDTVHELGCEMHLHSCGKIDELLPALIDWGLDAVELDSPRMTGFDALQKFRGRLMIWASINIQTVYAHGSPDECEQEVFEMINSLNLPEGGFGAYFYPQPHHLNVPSANIRAFRKGLEKYGRSGKSYSAG
ncbi:MAG TPA: uroporphyrinogen decarboxylase family protein [Desulfomonilia bacterium]